MTRPRVRRCHGVRRRTTRAPREGSSGPGRAPVRVALRNGGPCAVAHSVRRRAPPRAAVACRAISSTLATMTLLVIDGLKKHFGAQEILRGASAKIDPGEKVGLVGRNGGGKTTLFRIIAG